MQEEGISFQILRKESMDKSVQCFGHEFVFNKRASKYGKLLSWLKVLGILVPSLFGAAVIAYYKLEALVNVLISIFTFISIIQFGFSIWAIIYKWDEELAYSYEASQNYSDLHERFKKLAQVPPATLPGLEKQYEV